MNTGLACGCHNVSTRPPFIESSFGHASGCVPDAGHYLSAWGTMLQAIIVPGGDNDVTRRPPPALKSTKQKLTGQNATRRMRDSVVSKKTAPSISLEANVDELPVYGFTEDCACQPS